MIQPAVKVGQIWVEMDPRFERYVLVESLRMGTNPTANVRRVQIDGAAWPNARSLPARLDRFKGKRGGYAIHKDI